MNIPEWWPSDNNYIISDCLEGMKKLPDNSMNLIFADPPFNIGKKYGEYNDNRMDYHSWCKIWIGESIRLLKDTGSIYIMNLPKNIYIFQNILNDYNMIFGNIIIWKNSSMPVKNRYCPNYQPIIFYKKTKDSIFNCDAQKRKGKSAIPWGRKNKGNLMIDQWNDIPYISGGCIASKEAILNKDNKSKIHTAQMPLKLIERIILFSSNKNDIVFDPFLGSGTTIISAKMNNRIGLGFEINPDYENVIKNRLESYTPKLERWFDDQT